MLGWLDTQRTLEARLPPAAPHERRLPAFSSSFGLQRYTSPSFCKHYMRQLQMFQKVEYGGGPIFKVILEC